jgi:hypothetical protein
MKTMRLRRRLMEIIMFVSLITMILKRRLMEIIMFCVFDLLGSVDLFG